MRRGAAVRLSSACALALVGITAGSTWLACSNDPERLPAIGEVLLEVDTDAPVPSVVNRIRIDVFGVDGKWIDSRDVVRVNTVDWPLSFGLKALNERDTRDVIVRLRAYPEGRLRNYRGEHFTELATFTEPKVAHTITELCDSTPAIPSGEFTTRPGAKPLTGEISEPNDPTQDGGKNDCSGDGAGLGGASAFKVDVTTRDAFRFDVVGVNPYYDYDPVLILRKTCNDPLTQVTCVDDANPARDKELLNVEKTWPSLRATLDPGSYTLVVTSKNGSPGDITIRWGKASDFPGNAPPPDAGTTIPSGTEQPRLLADGGDVTPPQEPVPATAIDRLVHLQIKPDTVSKAHVILRSACSGVQAKLGTSIGEAATCIDTEKTLVPLALEALAPNDGIVAPSQQGSVVPVEPCTPADNTDNTVCIPGGAFLLGSLDTPNAPPTQTTPERLAFMHRYWIDKDEMSVARFRTLLAKGLQKPDASPYLNNGPLPKGYDVAGSQCTYSPSPIGGADDRENYPLNCVSWANSRAACQLLGGDLMSEAQYEYAATAAGRPVKTRWPWGGDDTAAVDCDRAVTGRRDPKDPQSIARGNLFTLCAARGFGPAPLGTSAGANGDVTALGVKNLAGSLEEWTLDSFQSYESDCWRAATLYDPICWERDAPTRASRGSSWYYPPLPPVRRNSYTQLRTGYITVGIRCAYASKPAVLP